MDLASLSCPELLDHIVELVGQDDPDATDDAVLHWLELYNTNPLNGPLEFERIRQDEAHFRKNEAFMDIMLKTREEFGFAPDIALEPIKVYCLIDGMEEVLAARGVISDVCKLMVYPSNDPESQRAFACEIFALLASKNTNIRNYIGLQTNAIGQILTALQSTDFRGNPRVVSACLGALINISYHSKATQKKIINKKGIETILELMTQHAGNAKIVLHCLITLRNLVGMLIGEETELVQSVVVKKTLYVMKLFEKLAEFQENALWVLAGAISKNPELKRFIGEFPGGIQTILDGAQWHKISKSVNLALAVVLSLLAKNAPNRTAIMKHRGHVALVEISLLQSTQDAAFYIATFKLLYRLAFNAANRAELGQTGVSGVFEAILRGMKTYPQNLQVQKIALLTLHKLSTDHGCMKIIQQNQELCSRTLSAMFGHSNNAPLVALARACVNNFMEGERIHFPAQKQEQTNPLTQEIKALRTSIAEKDEIIFKYQIDLKKQQDALKVASQLAEQQEASKAAAAKERELPPEIPHLKKIEDVKHEKSEKDKSDKDKSDKTDKAAKRPSAITRQRTASKSHGLHHHVSHDGPASPDQEKKQKSKSPRNTDTKSPRSAEDFTSPREVSSPRAEEYKKQKSKSSRQVDKDREIAASSAPSLTVHHHHHHHEKLDKDKHDKDKSGSSGTRSPRLSEAGSPAGSGKTPRERKPSSAIPRSEIEKAPRAGSSSKSGDKSPDSARRRERAQSDVVATGRTPVRFRASMTQSEQQANKSVVQISQLKAQLLTAQANQTKAEDQLDKLREEHLALKHSFEVLDRNMKAAETLVEMYKQPQAPSKPVVVEEGGKKKARELERKIDNLQKENQNLKKALEMLQKQQNEKI